MTGAPRRPRSHQQHGRRVAIGGRSSLLVWGLLLAVVALSARYFQGRQLDSRAPQGPELTGSARPIDGDSLVVGGREVRLKGIDAPEGRQTCLREGATWPCGEAARRELARLIGNQRVVCRSFGEDKHGRVLAVCGVGERNLNAEMVRAGLAVSYPHFGREEALARAARRGLWAGEFERPRDWRRRQGQD
jgi:endonuclease YncB( thermonuclease family)